jgi:PAS domain S-box-containing protein
MRKRTSPGGFGTPAALVILGALDAGALLRRLLTEVSAERVALAAALVAVAVLLYAVRVLRRARDSRYLALQVAARAEREARRTRDLLKAVIESLGDTVVTARDAQGRFVIANSATERVLGVPVEKILGHTPAETLPPGTALEVESASARVLATGETVTSEESVVRDGVERTLLITRSPLRDAGQITGTVAVSLDITERKLAELALRRSEEALRAAKEVAEAATRAKSEFLANMSHEIRTPMNSVIGMTELVLDTELAHDQRQYLEMVKASADSLLEIIDEILDFSRIEAGRLGIDPAPFDVYDLLAEPLKALSLRAQMKDVELALRIGAEVPRQALADGGRLRQVLVNLVGNAIKFTARGEVVVDVTAPPAGGDVVGRELCVAVRDTGIGIAPERQALIFEPFAQSDASTTRRFGGTGLGLAISSRIVEAMGGRIGVESREGVGSTFRFSVPIGVAAGSSAAAAAPPVPAGLRILVVDDSATARAILEEILAGYGIPHDTAATGAEALRRLRAGYDAGEPFDLVLLDARLAGVDGFGIARRIRRDPALAGTELAMMLTGAERRERLRSRKLGIHLLLVKPVTRLDLLRLLEQGAANGRAAPSERPALRPADEGPALRVLLAEDNHFNQVLALGLLQRLGHTVTVVDNGRAAVEASAREPFDLVLMDVQMPELDGIEATRRIRQREQGTARHLPIIALTAHARAADREWCLRSGMDGYVAKPLRTGQLREEIARTVAPAPPPAALGRGELLALVDGDTQLLRELLGLFAEDAPRLLQSARAAAAAADPAAVATAAHRLKGSARFFGPVPAATAAARLELLCRQDGVDAAAMGAALDELGLTLEALLRDLRTVAAS